MYCIELHKDVNVYPTKATLLSLTLILQYGKIILMKLKGEELMIRKQLLYSLIFSYIAIFITGISLYISLNKIALKSIEDEITKNYSSTLTKTIKNINYIIEDMNVFILPLKIFIMIEKPLSKNTIKEISFI